MAKFYTKRLTIGLTPQISDYLDRMLATGLYGLTRTAAARELLCRAIREQSDVLETVEALAKKRGR